MKEFFKKIYDKILNIFFPKDIKCLFCGRDINEGELYCDDCAKNAPFNNGKRCLLCDEQIFGEGDVCEECKHRHNYFDRILSPMKYESEAVGAVKRLKQNRGLYLAPKMAKLMLKRLQEEKLSFDLIIPVPLFEKSLKARGYNQSELIAEQLSKMLNVPMNNSALIKIKSTHEQKNLPFAKRKNNIIGAFKVADKKAIFKKSILLVDDVVTTCATVNECAKVLKKYASKVYVVSFARTNYRGDN